MRLNDTSGQWKVTDIDLHGKEGATYQNLFDGTKREIALVYFPGTMAHIKESEKEDIAPPKSFMA